MSTDYSAKAELTDQRVKIVKKLEDRLNDAWLNLDDIDDRKIPNPLAKIPVQFQDNPHQYVMWLLMQPSYLHFMCKVVFGKDLEPIQITILQELWKRKFPFLVMARGGAKSFLLALYSLLRMLLLPGRKLVVCGASFRQSKVIFEYMENIWGNSPMLRDLVGPGGGRNGPFRSVDMCKFNIDNSATSALPVGNGDKIRGQRANDIITDEFAAVPLEVFEKVIFGFGSVTSNPMENVKLSAKKRLAAKLGYDLDIHDEMLLDNQVILSGTCDFIDSPFGTYFTRWQGIINSCGDNKKLCELFTDGEVPENFKWDDYSLIRIPWDLLPEGHLDKGMIARAKTTLDKAIFQQEYGAICPKDSNGFFRRSLVEACVTNKANNICHPSEQCITFSARLNGDKKWKYVMAVDPASERDNFSIVILELHSDHRRVVYVWTITKKELRQRIKDQEIGEVDFYSYCARKIRDLMIAFPIERIAIDTQGGGYSVMESLNNSSVVDSVRGEKFLWTIVNMDKPQDTDHKAGLHIIEPVSFVDYSYTYNANHNLKADFESKTLLFPSFDALDLGLASLDDADKKTSYDGLEDCVTEIEETKKELYTIVVTKTEMGNRDRWDTPEIKEAGSKKGRMKKDRYSALLMANACARSIQVDSDNPEYGFGRIGQANYYEEMENNWKDVYMGNNPLAERLRDVY